MARTSSEPKGANGAPTRELLALAQRMRSLGVLSSRTAWADSLGLPTHYNKDEGAWKRYLWTACGYPDTDPEIGAYRALYRRGGIAERVVEAYPRATWSGGASIQDDPDPENVTRFEETVAELFKRLDAWAKLQRADILAGLGEYAVLLIGDGQLTEQPLRKTTPEKLYYLRPLGQDAAILDEDLLVDEASNPRYGLPEFYKLKLGLKAAERQQEKRGHWSRIIHVVDTPLDDDLRGKPRLRAIYNRLIDLEKVIGSGAEAAWKRADPGVNINLPLLGKDGEPVEIDSGVLDKLEDVVDEYQHKLRRAFYTRGAEVNLLSAEVVDFGKNVDSILQQISATTGIPYRILTGSERGELASTQDRNNWNDRIAERRQEYAEPIVRDLVGRWIEHGIVPEPAEGEFQIVWPEGEELDEQEKAEVLEKIATANQRQFMAGQPPFVTSDEGRDMVLGLDPLADVAPELLNPVEPEPDPNDPEALRAAAAGEQEAVRRAGERHAPRLASLWVDSWSAAASEIDNSALVAALEAGERSLAQQIVFDALGASEEALTQKLAGRLLEALAAGGNAAARSVRARGSFLSQWDERQVRGAALSVSFDSENPRAVEWAEREGGSLVVEVGPETRAAIASLIERGFTEGIPPRKLARQLREVVGLHDRYATAVANLAQRMRDAKPGDLVMAGRTKIRIPKTGATEELIAKRAAEYASRLRNNRALTIARHKTVQAANEGQHELWRQAGDSGELPSTIRREWLTAGDDRVRDEHADHEGVTVGIDEPWPWGYEPGEEVGCRCGQGLVE